MVGDVNLESEMYLFEDIRKFGPGCKIIGLRGFRQNEIQTSLLSYRD